MSNRELTCLLAGLAACLLTGCGGSSSSQQTAGIDGTGGPPVAVLSSGTVTGFGSVIVNGVHFDTSSTTFTVDGQPGSQNDLAVGDVVIVQGELDADDSTFGKATSITFDHVAEGPISAIDRTAGVLIILGQTVRISGDTSLDDSIQPPSIDGLSVDDIIVVSGFVASDGSISATRVEPSLATNELGLSGTVSNLDVPNSQFSINGQVVDYSAAMLLDFDDGTIDEGDFVAVKSGASLGSNGELRATRIEFKGANIAAVDGDRAEIEGFISRFVDITDFDVSGFPTTTNGNLTIEGGGAGDLGLDVKVEVEGTMQGGVLEATKIDIRRGNAVRIAGNTDSVNTAGSSFVVLGVTVKVDGQTRLEDKGPQDIENFSLSDLQVDDYVEVRGAELPAGSGEVLATLLERNDDVIDVELRGFVEAGTAVNPSFSILGVSITTTGTTAFRDTDDSVISADTFFSSAEGRLVKVNGLEVGDRAISASEVELER